MPLFDKLENMLAAAAERRDLVVVILIITAIGAMVMPITPIIADVLISINLTISVVLLMVAFYVHSPADFAALPSIVLITTVFRLSISVAATRLILLEGEGGRIVQAFGDFVIAGNVAVGLVIFLIITVVQFIVITKGSERVAEVAARFSLDGLPGKQMSIDSDLRNGDIDQIEARRRRQNLERETQLFGAMDGAMKFVKGDSMAGIIIISLNLIGGIAIGMVQRNLSFGDSVQLFSILTVGEGLIAQIPALFISLTAGTVVTRVGGGGDKQNLGKDIISQIASRPDALRMSAGVLLGLALVPGFPSAVFLTFAVFLGVSGTILLKNQDNLALAGGTGPGQIEIPAVSELIAGQPVMAVTVLASPAFAAQIPPRDTQRRLAAIAHKIAHDLGFATPAIGYKVDTHLIDNSYAIELDMVPEVIRNVSFDCIYAPSSEARALETSGIQPVPAFNNVLGFFALRQQEEATLKAADIEFYSVAGLLEGDVSHILRRNASYFVGIQETKRLLGGMEGAYKELLREVQRVAPTQRVADVLRKLLDEGIPIRNLRLILEAILEWSPREGDTQNLTEHVRRALRRQICFKVADPGKVIHALVLEREAEDSIRRAAQDASSRGQFMLDADLMASYGEAIHGQLLGTPKTVAKYVVILVSPDLRRIVSSMLSHLNVIMPVLAYPEIAADFAVQTLATIAPPHRRT